MLSTPRFGSKREEGGFQHPIEQWKYWGGMKSAWCRAYPNIAATPLGNLHKQTITRALIIRTTAFSWTPNVASKPAPQLEQRKELQSRNVYLQNNSRVAFTWYVSLTLSLSTTLVTYCFFSNLTHCGLQAVQGACMDMTKMSNGAQLCNPALCTSQVVCGSFCLEL